jgi:hypothetical protein
MKVEASKTMVGQYGKPWEDDDALLSMSALKEKGVNAVKNVACERRCWGY